MTWRKPLWKNGSASFLYSARFDWGACHGGYSCPKRPPIASKYLCAHAVSNLAYPAAFIAIRATNFFGVGKGAYYGPRIDHLWRVYREACADAGCGKP